MSKSTILGKPIKRLFLDIETSPNIGLFWRAGNKISVGHDAIIHERGVICVCWKWEGEREVHDATWDDAQNDRGLLIKILSVMEEADEVIAHFGEGFDIPWLRTRILYHDLNPMPLFKVIDTKAWASKYFYFNSNKLDYIAKFLGFGGKIKTEWDWWVQILMHNCRKTLHKMVVYNKRDVVLLENVWAKLQRHCPSHVHAGVLMGMGKWTCPRTGSRNVSLSKVRVTATGIKRYQMQNNETGGYYSINSQAYESYIKETKRVPSIRRTPTKGNGGRHS